MIAITEALSSIELFADLPGDTLDQLGSCGQRRHFAVDEIIIRAEQPVDAFYLVESGRVAVEVAAPRSDPLLIETIDAGGIVGVSWLLPPYRWVFGARAIEATTAIAVDAEAVRSLAEDDPVFGYEMYKRFASIIHDRLVSSRLRLLDLYGTRSHQ